MSVQPGRGSTAPGTHGTGCLDTGSRGSVDPKHSHLPHFLRQAGPNVKVLLKSLEIWFTPSAAGGARVCSAASSCSCCSCCVTRLLICRLQRAAGLVPASSRSDGSSVLAPIFFRLRLARPQELGGADNMSQI